MNNKKTFTTHEDPRKYEVFSNEKLPQLEYTVNIDGCGCCPRGDIIAIKAKSKNGKTFLATLFASAILGAHFEKVYAYDEQTPNTLLYFDTEQNRINTQLIVKRIHTICSMRKKIEKERFHAYCLREMGYDARLNFIEGLTMEKKPTAIVVDGIADLILDFNDIEKSQDVISRLMKLSSSANCACFIVIHTNKGKDDDTMKGHLGTMAWQKCSDVFSVEKDNEGNFNVKETDCRNRSVSPFSFRISHDGIPFIPEENTEEDLDKSVQVAIEQGLELQAQQAAMEREKILEKINKKK